MEGLIPLGILVVIGLIAYLVSVGRDSNYAKLNTIKAEEEKKKNRYDALISEYTFKKNKLEKDRATFDKLVAEKLQAYPHLAAIKADLMTIYYEDAAEYLSTKKSPAYTAAENIRRLRADTEKALAEKHVIEYKLAYLQQLYPVLSQVLSEEFDESNLPKLKKNISLPPQDSCDKRAEILQEQISSLRNELKECRSLEEDQKRTIQLLRQENLVLKKTRSLSSDPASSYSDVYVQSILDSAQKQKEEILQLKKHCDDLRNDIETKDTLISNFGFSSLQERKLPLISAPLLFAYENSLKTDRLEKATNESFSFQYPLTISGIVSSAENQYTTTLQSCTCPDFEIRHTVCKHMLALALQVHAFTPYEDKIHTLIEALIEERGNLNIKWIEIEKNKNEYKKLQKALNDRYQTHPYLAEIVANYKAAKIEANVKDPKTKRDLMAQIKRVEKEKAMLQNQIAVYEYMFPVLNSFKEAPPDKLEQAISNADGTGFHYQWLSPEEYATLTSVEKQQRWIEKYFHHRSANAWEAGIKYERYIGYLCEKEGYKVKYSGALLKLNDMGRDLIATKGKSVYIIQCKRFADHKEIHENHLFQLFGSVTHYASEHPDKKVTGVFVTSTKLSSVAAECADKLSLERYENVVFQEYPIIKCNVSHTGEKIYHLPFDQQYDSVSVEVNKGECYVATVDEAEALGYRHAMRHTYIT